MPYKRCLRQHDLLATRGRAVEDENSTMGAEVWRSMEDRKTGKDKIIYPLAGI